MTAGPSGGPARIESEVSRLLNLHDGPHALPHIVAFGGAAIPALECVLRGPSQAVYHPRCWAADALASIGGSLAAQALLRALDDSVHRDPAPLAREAEDVVVGCVAEHLSAIAPSAQTISALANALECRAYVGCVRALGRLRAVKALPLLVRSLFDDSTREAAVEALRRLGPAAIAPVVDAVGDLYRVNGIEPPTHIDGRAAAAVLLGTLLHQNPLVAEALRDRALSGLRHALRDSQRRVRAAAALSLIRAEDRVRTAIRVLVRALDEPDRRRLTPILRTLNRLGPRIEPALFEVMASHEIGERATRRLRHAVWLAGQLHTAASAAALSRMRSVEDTALRRAIIAALDRNTATPPEALEHYLADGDVGVRRHAVQALHQREALSVPRALLLLGDPDKQIRTLAALCLSRHPASSRRALRRAVLALGAPLKGLYPRLRLLYHGLLWRCRGIRRPPHR
ncbi:MAG TPA: hypothetical protein VHB68_16925 [Steroidobacteraceae bacterium]|nr:hypothetical protein [Steroidobacteraceae bacterium]